MCYLRSVHCLVFSAIKRRNDQQPQRGRLETNLGKYRLEAPHRYRKLPASQSVIPQPRLFGCSQSPYLSWFRLLWFQARDQLVSFLSVHDQTVRSVVSARYPSPTLDHMHIHIDVAASCAATNLVVFLGGQLYIC